MSQYKVPQNVEAEDKILGPLTFKQFLYAIFGVGWGILCFAIFRAVPAVMIIVGFPPVMLFLLLAFYQRDGQNFEQLLIAMVGFFASERKRIWVKEPIIESFHVEPTKVVAEATQRDPQEVKSELEKLATLIDSRGWNRPPDFQPETARILPNTAHEDRIVAPPAPHAPDEPKSDMLDLQHSPLAQNLAQLLSEAADDVKAEAMQQMNTPTRRAMPAAASVSGVTGTGPNDILRLATLNDDLSIQQLQARANRLSAPASQGQMVDPTPNAS